MKLNFVCVELNFVCVELNFIWVELNFVCVELNFIWVELNFVCVKLNFVCEIDLKMVYGISGSASEYAHSVFYSLSNTHNLKTRGDRTKRTSKNYTDGRNKII